MSEIKDPEIAKERAKVEFKRAKSACPIDFSIFRNSNPRANTVQKEYNSNGDTSNFNNRKKYQDDEEPQFTADFGSEPGQFPVEPGRYRLIWSSHCPWAQRIAIAIDLLGLDKYISKGLVDPLRPAGVVGGWYYTLDKDGADPILGLHSLMESYKLADPDYDQRATVPALVDTKTKAVINNDFHDLTLQLYTGWKNYIDETAPDIYPEELRADIDALNVILYAEINTVPALASMSKSQEEYEFYYDMFFRRLDWLEERLATHRYLLGDTITDSDIRLYVSLARHDMVFYQKYYLNKKRLVDYPNLWNYAKDLYSNKAFGGTTDFNAMRKRFYYVDHTPFNDFPRLMPKGVDDTRWLEPNDRAAKFSK